ncbi:MAG: type I methionyl aminopeptidase [Roseivirga sp.]
MVFLKSEEEIALIRESAAILSQTHGVIAREVKPGVTTRSIDALAEAFIRDHGGTPSFKGYRRFPATLCISVNEYVVHGVPSDYTLKEGDIVSIDCGVYYKGFHSDAAFTHPVGEISEEKQQLLRVTREALYHGIDAIQKGSRTGDVGHAIQQHVQVHGYSVVRELVGHGVGRRLHEAPNMPNYGNPGSGVKLKKGMVLAIEPMVNLGVRQIVEERGGQMRTLDKKPSAHFEHTVAVLEEGVEILTTYKYIEEDI